MREREREREREKTAVTQEDWRMLTEELKSIRENMVERLHEWDSKLEGYRDMEEKGRGENKDKSKKPSNITSDGVRQQTGNRKFKLVEKQTVRKDENMTMKDRSEIFRIFSFGALINPPF